MVSGGPWPLIFRKLQFAKKNINDLLWAYSPKSSIVVLWEEAVIESFRRNQFTSDICRAMAMVRQITV